MSFVPIKSVLQRFGMRGARGALWLIAAGMPLPALPARLAPAGRNARRGRARPGIRGNCRRGLRSNPEIQAALKEKQAAQHRIAPAGALDDPMLEAGVLNLPTDTLRPRSRRHDHENDRAVAALPVLRQARIAQEYRRAGRRVGESWFRETVNRVLREIKIAYYDLALTVETQRLTGKNRALLGQLLKVTESRYAVGLSTQADVLKAQTQFTKMLDELFAA